MEYFSLSIEEFANEVGLSRQTIIDIMNGHNNVNKETLEKIYSYPYASIRSLDINRTKELLYLDEIHYGKLLFHGARGDIEGEVDTKHSVPPNDFGNGFYTGETLSQAASWVAMRDNPSIYCFALKDMDSLKVIKFSANLDWLFVVLYFRDTFYDYEPNEWILNLVKKVEEADLIVAPIADNEMFATIDSFARNEITDEACIHAISASNLGIQYVFKNEKACKKLHFIDRLYLCEKERKEYLKIKDTLSEEGIQKSRLAKIEYRRKGKYFDELFKKKR